MHERWIINASPLIVLARVGHESLLQGIADEVVVPEAVAREIQAGPPEDRARQIVDAGCFRIVETPPPPRELLAWDLGAGETAVLSLALASPGWTAKLDDAAARKCARSLSVSVRGTLSVVLLAKQQGLVPSAAEVLRALKTGGFRLNDAVVREALSRAADEVW